MNSLQQKAIFFLPVSSGSGSETDNYDFGSDKKFRIKADPDQQHSHKEICAMAYDVGARSKSALRPSGIHDINQIVGMYSAIRLAKTQ